MSSYLKEAVATYYSMVGYKAISKKKKKIHDTPRKIARKLRPLKTVL